LQRLSAAFLYVLVLTKSSQLGFDVFNALTLLDNPLFLADQKFGPGDGRLHYYLFNYRCAPIAGGVNEKNEASEKFMDGVGIVML
jgi:glycylpeptide N-tetradecanoyltransferase